MKKTKTNKVAKAGGMIMTATNCIGLYIFTVRYYCILLKTESLDNAILAF